MSLEIKTFSNADLSQGWRPGNNAGGQSLFKALGHPQTARRAQAMMDTLAQSGRIAVYDPTGMINNFHAYYDLTQIDMAGYYVQRVEDLGTEFMGYGARPLTELSESGADKVLVLLFDAERILAPLSPVFDTLDWISLDEVRIDDSLLSNPRDYLDPLNFATNFALFRDKASSNGEDGLHTRVATANYWGFHGATDPALWLCLIAEDGTILAEWEESLPGPNAPVVLDSRDVRSSQNLDDFSGSLYIHAVRIKGHDVVKYALDIFGEDGAALSCNHDANAWPADYYAGMPAPDADETLYLFVQNSHPMEIPANVIGFGRVGHEERVNYDKPIAPFATAAIDVGALLPDTDFPDQIEITAGRYFVRPRYEVRRGNRHRRIAHANVERTDLKPDPNLPELGKTMGKGYIMPLPVLPTDRFETIMLPTPMARDEESLPVKAVLVDGDGTQRGEKFLGNIARSHHIALDIQEWMQEQNLELSAGHGHVEFLYDFREGGDGNGWLHALARIEQKSSGHRAETIFGAHIFNTPIIYKDEPQSYINRPPGLTTRLFLRIGHHIGLETMCKLIYPASLPWHDKSSTVIQLIGESGQTVAERNIEIACGGSTFFLLSEMYSTAELEKTGASGYVLIRDTSCRLFGFHGLLQSDKSFCLDHMFGF